MHSQLGFNPYAVGQKQYGFSMSPHFGGGLDKTGYMERDRKAQAYRNAILQRLQAGLGQNYMSSNYMGVPNTMMRGKI